MSFDTPPLKLPQIAVVPPNRAQTALDQDTSIVRRNFTDATVSATNYLLPICPACWSDTRAWTAQQCVLLQSRNGDQS